MAPLNRTDPVSTSVSLCHQEASISLFLIQEGRQNENHNHRQLIKLITWTTALSKSMKLWAMPCRAIQDTWVMVESSDKMWSTGEGKGKPLQYSCLENLMNSQLVSQFSRSVVSDSLRPHESQHARPPCPSPTPGVPSNSSPSSWWCHPAISSSVVPFFSCPQSLKRQKDRTLKDELPGLVGAQYSTGKSGEITPERMKRQSQSKNNTQLWMWLVMEVKSSAVKSNIALEPGMLSPWTKANWKWSNRRWQEWISTF